MTVTDVDRVRLAIGDADESDQLLSDDDLQVFIDARQIETTDGDTVTNIPAAAADACAALAAKFARHFNFAEDGQRFDVSQRVSQFLALETALRSRAGGAAEPFTFETS